LQGPQEQFFFPQRPPPWGTSDSLEVFCEWQLVQSIWHFTSSASNFDLAATMRLAMVLTLVSLSM